MKASASGKFHERNNGQQIKMRKKRPYFKLRIRFSSYFEEVREGNNAYLHSVFELVIACNPMHVGAF